jgi:4-amino-4-deoxychorismate lyase
MTWRGISARPTASAGASAAAADAAAAAAAEIPVLSATEVHARLAAGAHPRAVETFAAFYSSWVGGITTDPAAMVLPVDDHMVHRGHAVFDTAHLQVWSAKRGWSPRHLPLCTDACHVTCH